MLKAGSNVAKSRPLQVLIRVSVLFVKARIALTFRFDKFDGQFLFPQNERNDDAAKNFDFRLYNCHHTLVARPSEKRS